MSKGLYRCDLHSHPLCHDYYPITPNKASGVVLNEQDKEKIRWYVNWCIEERELDAIAITDHDLIQSSLYAREYAKENSLPITIITGAECEIFIRIGEQFKYCHILVLGVNEIPYHEIYMNEVEFALWVNDIHALGGIVVMSHPAFSCVVFDIIAEYLDGFEVINRDVLYFTEGLDYRKEDGSLLLPLKNSDYHYAPGYYQDTPIEMNYLPKEWVDKLTW